MSQNVTIRRATKEGTLGPLPATPTPNPQCTNPHSSIQTLTSCTAPQADVPEILALIKELADFEKCPERVQATEATLLQTLSFASPSSADPSATTSGYAHTFLLTVPSELSSDGSDATAPNGTAKGEVVAGFALYFFNYSTWLATPGIYLEDLFVRPQFRRGGYATLLIRRLALEAHRLTGGRGRLEWSCLRWNQGALDFYERLGGERLDEWVGIRVEGEKLAVLAGDV